MNFKAQIVIAAMLMACPSFAVTIHDLGNMGEVYPVKEPDLRQELKKRARNIDWKEFEKKVKRAQPKDIQHLPAAREDRTFLVDMNYTFKRDIKDGKGRVIYPKGFTFNPLDYMRFPGGMVFIDGSDENQCRWFEQTPYYKNHRVKLLITDGFTDKLVYRWHRPVFYLTKPIADRFHLKAVPAVAVQEGRKIKIVEVALDNSGRN